MSINIVQYDEFREKLDEIKEACNHIPDASSKEGYEKAKRVALDVGKVLTNIEKTRKEQKKYWLDGGKQVDAQAKEIVSLIEPLMLPHKEAYKEVDNIKKEAEKKRVADLEERIENMRMMPEVMRDQSSDDVKSALDCIQDESCEDFQEFTNHALKTRNTAATELARLYDDKLKHEQEQAELEQLRAEKEERDRKDYEESLKREAAAKAEREKQEAIEREEAAKQQAIDAENARVEAEKQAEINRIEAEKQAKIQAEQAAENARLAEIERQRQEEEAARIEKEKREANTKHIGAIRKTAKESIMALGHTEEEAKKLVLAIHNNLITNVTINY